VSGYNYEDHLEMMRDSRRMTAYRAAIAAVVRPGDVVLDLGAGAGIMTLLALEAGAARVHAIEWSDNVEILRKVARANGIADRVTIHCDDSRHVRLPELTDVLIADIRGPLPVCGEGLAVMHDARKRLLKPDGRMIPLSDRIFIAPIEYAKGHEHVSGWKNDFASMRSIAASRYLRSPFEAAAVLAPAAASEPLRYDGSLQLALDIEATFEVVRAGTCHGVGAWFEAELAPGVRLSTAPEHGESVYGQAYFPVDQPPELDAGDRVHVQVGIRTAPVEPVMLWNVRVETGPSAGFEEPRCSVDGIIMTLDALRKRSSGHVPTLNESGRASLFVLERMAQRAALGAIAEQLREAFPDRFASLDDASAYVGKLSTSFSE